MTDKSMAPAGVNHIVFNVRNLEESHRFWTEVVGFEQVGELTPTEKRPNPPKMRFYSAPGNNKGHLNHHDVAIVENPDLPPPPENWSMFGGGFAVNHVAIAFPTREAWLARLEYLQAKGVKFGRRVNHGMTHSLYISDPNGYGVELLYELPHEVWGGDINAALNYVEVLPTEGKEALVDSVKNPVFAKEAVPAE